MLVICWIDCNNICNSKYIYVKISLLNNGHQYRVNNFCVSFYIQMKQMKWYKCYSTCDFISHISDCYVDDNHCLINGTRAIVLDLCRHTRIKQVYWYDMQNTQTKTNNLHRYLLVLLWYLYMVTSQMLIRKGSAQVAEWLVAERAITWNEKCYRNNI